MGLVSGLAVFFLVWWVVLFAVLPWGVRSADRPDVGHAPSAPINPRIRTKFVATTVLAAVIWVLIYIVVSLEVISFRDWADAIAAG